MKITVLVENTTKSSLKCEHGLSLLIEYNNKTILLDTGSSNLFYENANIMGLDISKVDIAILSHGHYDHSGGYNKFFEVNNKAMLYMRENALNKYYSANGGMHEIGVPTIDDKYKDRIIFTNDNITNVNDLYLVSHNTPGLSLIGDKAKLYMLNKCEIVPDDFNHEQSLVFDTPNGLVVFNSCSHAGFINIVNEVEQALNKKVYAYIGGLHMKGTINNTEICIFNESEINELSKFINKNNINVYTGHCTGEIGYNSLKEKTNIKKLYTGQIIEL